MTVVPPHIAVICSRLDLPGGTEHAIVRTANLWRSMQHPVTLVILDESREIYFPVDPSVQIIHAPLHFGITNSGNKISRKLSLWRHIRKLKKLLNNIDPDVVISTEYHFAIAQVMASGNAAHPLLSWEHHHFHELKKNRFWEFLFRKYYPRLNRVVCLNSSEAALFEKAGAATIVIPNFISIQKNATPGQRLILTVARLSEVKGIDRLLQVATIVLKNHPDWQWLLIGDGPMQDIVEETILKEQLQNKLILRPPQGPDLTATYKTAAFYVMTSRNECFPMVLLEAMSHGLPCVAFDCETGPRHIIENSVNGLLVEEGDVNAMATAVSGLMTDADLRNKMGAAATDRMKTFAPTAVYEKWEALFEDLLKRS